jgi:hypothetical protein
MVVTGCGRSPMAPSASGPSAATIGKVTNIGDPQERTFVLLGKLYSYEDPNENNVIGALELRLRQSIGDPHIFEVTGLAHLVPRDEAYIRGNIANGLGEVIIAFVRPEIDLRTPNLIFTLSATIPSTAANQMLDDPNEFTVVFYTAYGPAAVGRLKLAAPPEPE